jgi:hypothetical protein
MATRIGRNVRADLVPRNLSGLLDGASNRARLTADGRLTTVTGMVRLIIGSVVIPFLFVIVMSGVEYLAKPRLLWDLMTDVGWDR